MKTLKICLAILLCALLPVTALAETVDAYYIRITDVEADLPDGTSFSLDGLDLQLLWDILESDVLTRVDLKVDETKIAGLTYNQTDSGIAVVLDGLKNALKLDYKTVLEQMQQQTTGSGVVVGGASGKTSTTTSTGTSKGGAIIRKGSSKNSANTSAAANVQQSTAMAGASMYMSYAEMGEKMADVSKKLTAFLNKIPSIENRVTSTAVEEYDGVRYVRKDFSYDEETMESLIKELLGILDETGLFNQLAYDSAIGNYTYKSLTERWEESNVSAAVDGAYWYAADNDFTYDVFVTLTNEDYPDEIYDIELYIDTKKADDVQQFTASITIYENDEAEQELYLTGSVGPDSDGDECVYLCLAPIDYSYEEEGEVEGTLTFTYYPDYQDSERMMIVYTDEDGEQQFALRYINTFGEVNNLYVSLELPEDEEINMITLDCDYLFEDQVILDMSLEAKGEDNSASLNVVFSGEKTDDSVSGIAGISVAEESYGQKVGSASATFGLEFGRKQVEEDALKIDFSGATDVMKLTKAEQEQLEKELVRVLMSDGFLLIGKLPDLTDVVLELSGIYEKLLG